MTAAGGARAGAGRPVSGRKVRRWVNIEAVDDARISEHAARAGVPVAAILRDIIHIAVINSSRGLQTPKTTKTGKPS
jgi:hypothetical protein